MFLNACRKILGCFSKVTSITACKTKYINNIGFEALELMKTNFTEISSLLIITSSRYLATCDYQPIHGNL